MIDYHSDDETRLKKEARLFSEIDPAIRAQLTRQYREWNNARSKLRGELKCNGCKNYFPRDEVTRVYPGASNKYNVYCQPCLERRIARNGDRRGIETRYFSVGER